MRTFCRAMPTTNHRRCSRDVPDMEAMAVIFFISSLERADFDEFLQANKKETTKTFEQLKLRAYNVSFFYYISEEKCVWKCQDLR